MTTNLERELASLRKRDVERLAKPESEREPLTGLNDLIAQLRHGDTTGDPLRDYAVMEYGIDQRYEDVLRALQTKMEEKKGQFILVAEESSMQRRGTDGSPPPICSVSIGVLVDPTFVFNTRGIGFDVDQHILIRDFHRADLERKGGPICLDRHFEMVYLYNADPGATIAEVRSNGARAISICIGDEEVLHWFSSTCARRLGTQKGFNLTIAIKCSLALERDLNTIPVLADSRHQMSMCCLEALRNFRGKRNEIRRYLETSVKTDPKTDLEKIAELRAIREKILKELMKAISLQMNNDPLVMSLLSEYGDMGA